MDNVSSAQARLYEELRELRRRGWADPQDRLHQYELLLDVARLGGRGSTDKERVKNVLEQAIERMGSVYGPALRTLFGLTEASYGLKATARHKLAHDVFRKAERALAIPHAGHKPIAFENFRTHKQEEMLKDLANQLLRIARRSDATRRA